MNVSCNAMKGFKSLKRQRGVRDSYCRSAGSSPFGNQVDIDKAAGWECRFSEGDEQHVLVWYRESK